MIKIEGAEKWSIWKYQGGYLGWQIIYILTRIESSTDFQIKHSRKMLTFAKFCLNLIGWGISNFSQIPFIFRMQSKHFPPYFLFWLSFGGWLLLYSIRKFIHTIMLASWHQAPHLADAAVAPGHFENAPAPGHIPTCWLSCRIPGPSRWFLPNQWKARLWQRGDVIADLISFRLAKTPNE